MKKYSPIEQAVSSFAEPIAVNNGLELVDVEFIKEREKWFLRIFIDKPGGVGLDDCERMSRALDIVLDEKDPIPQSYYLEVSSPGVERPLKKADDFKRFQGEKALVKTYSPIGGRRKFEGRIVDSDESSVTLESENEKIQIIYESISKAHLIFEW